MSKVQCEQSRLEVSLVLMTVSQPSLNCEVVTHTLLFPFSVMNFKPLHFKAQTLRSPLQ